MIPVLEKGFRFARKVIHQVGDTSDDSKSAESSLISVELPFTDLTFFRMYVLLLPSSFSISFARSLDISSDEMFANVHSANPTAYMFE